MNVHSTGLKLPNWFSFTDRERGERTHHSIREGRDHCHCQITNLPRLLARSEQNCFVISHGSLSDVKQKIKLVSVSVNKNAWKMLI